MPSVRPALEVHFQIPAASVFPVGFNRVIERRWTDSFLLGHSVTLGYRRRTVTELLRLSTSAARQPVSNKAVKSNDSSQSTATPQPKQSEQLDIHPIDENSERKLNWNKFLDKIERMLKEISNDYSSTALLRGLGQLLTIRKLEWLPRHGSFLDILQVNDCTRSDVAFIQGFGVLHDEPPCETCASEGGLLRGCTACVDREKVATAQRRILPTDNPDNGQIVQTGAAQGDVMYALSISRAETPLC
ncbi:hypothetical protein CIHG_06172 [Coccidioides immitis H538.4]|uniref:Uncharacterized protein n=1 Tax=Coccidioides immitis H538.4 TaxID=396776 RepID=A0A0J8RT33_COCIT|nr:hypothetical protein CIHG_06172 [Coccidioides immitis H538.4]